MGKGSEPSGGGGENRVINYEAGRATKKKIEEAKRKAAPVSAKSREVGVRYTPTLTASGGLRKEASVMRSSPSGELAPKLGMSPGDIKPIVGSVGDMSADVVAGNIAGRTDVNAAMLSDLVRRARVGNVVSPIPTPGGVGLGAIGRIFAGRKLDALASDTPTADGYNRPQYGTSIVTDARGGISEVVDSGSSRSAVGPVSRDEGGVSQATSPSPKVETALKTMSTATKRRIVSRLGAGSGEAQQRKFFG
jgi:hypothetical protein